MTKPNVRVGKLLFGGVLLLAAVFYLVVPQPAEAANRRIVTIFADGQSRTISTSAAIVSDVLSEAGIAAGDNDLVEPAIDTPIFEPVFSVNIFRARSVKVIDGEREFSVISPYQSPRLIAESVGLKVYPEDEFQLSLIDDIASENAIGQRLVIDRSVPVKVDLYGNRVNHRTQAGTVGEMLTEMGITPSKSDVVSADLDDEVEANSTIHVIRVGERVVAKRESIPFTTRTIQDSNLPAGEQKVKQAGRTGEQLVTYEARLHNGKVVGRKVLQRVIVRKPVEEVVIVGTAYSGDFKTNADIIAALRMCETHGNYNANTGNGFYGAYQFMASTWDRTAQRTGQTRWVGVLPSDAPPSVQDAFVIDNARASSGGFWSQHPGCSNSLGLPQFPY